jgi:asparagine synthase (glutamine-hydrolysing)
MCGIVGFTGSDPKNFIYSMNDSQKHRGPDSEGYYICPINNVNFAMKRLSIIDFSGGAQPLTILDGRYTIVFNGEIFNAPELRLDLESKGVRFNSTHSDTEVLPYLYAFYGVDMVKMLNGMFAFAIYDRDKSTIFCARDHYGIKPFFYSTCGKRFSFSSEIKSLQELPWISRKIDKSSIYHYFSFQCIPSPMTVYEDIRKLPAGNFLTFNIASNELIVNEYWLPKYGGINLSPEALPEFVTHEFEMAVKRWMQSDVEVGVSLSGGLDSAAIVSIAARNAVTPIRTYTLGFDDMPGLDERSLASLVSDRYQTKHTEIVLGVYELLKNVDHMLSSLDEPYAGGLPSWFVYKAMSREVKVGMTGVGGDELFGNYGKWLPYQNILRLGGGIRRHLKSGGGLIDFIREVKGSLYQPFHFKDNLKRKIFSNDFLSGLNDDSARLVGSKLGSTSNIRNMLSAFDFGQQLPEEFLMMTDRFSMAHSLEMRTPFLDITFSEKINSIPHRYRENEQDFKFLLRRALLNFLPKEILHSKKRGFVLPLDSWLRGALSSELLELSDPKFLSKQGIFNNNLRDSMIKPFLDRKSFSVDQVWTWWMFQRWWLISGSYI